MKLSFSVKFCLSEKSSLSVKFSLSVEFSLSVQFSLSARSDQGLVVGKNSRQIGPDRKMSNLGRSGDLGRSGQVRSPSTTVFTFPLAASSLVTNQQAKQPEGQCARPTS